MLIASLITAAISSGSVLFLLYSTAKPKTLRILLTASACTLPMCWVMFHFIRLPIDQWLLRTSPNDNVLFWIRAVYAPVTEEPAKLWPLVFPFIRRSLTSHNLAFFAIALGSGFAVGEVFTVADLIQNKMPHIAGLPWYHLSGFISERLMTVAIHSGVTATALLVMSRGAGLIAGLSASVSLHFIVNLPIALSKSGWFESSPLTALVVLQIWITLCCISSVIFLLWISGGDRELGLTIYGTAICPSCGSQYPRSLLKGINFGFDLRLEPCAACRKWHWTRRINKVRT